jgi:hypothetical protein
MSTATEKKPRKRSDDAAKEESPTKDGRRLEPVGLAMGTVLVALALSALLNAEGTHKNASSQPDSAARDVAMFVSARVADVSGFLGLTEPRKGVEALVGNSGKDEIHNSIDTTGVKKAAPPVPTKQVFTAARPMKLYAGGDSLSLETAAALQAVAPKTGVINMAEPDGHLNTGLERTDVMNWFERAREVEATIKPDVSILVFGGNDNDSYMSGGPGGGFEGAVGSPGWRAEYGRRVGLMMDTLTQRKGQTLIWVGAPVAQDEALNSDMKILNQVYKAQAMKRPGSVIYLDSDPIFAPNGSFQTSIVYQGKQRMVREPDGQHLNTDGGVVLADVIMELLEKRFVLKGAKPRAPIVTGG